MNDARPLDRQTAEMYAAWFKALAEDHLTPEQRRERGGQAGCIAGAPSFAEYRAGLARAGFTGITVTPTHQGGDGVHAAIIRAVKR